MAKKKFYITTAIDYVNAKPHCGHLYEKVIADALARWHRMLGEDVFFLTGTDDNASKNEEAAEKAGMPVRDFVDKNAEFFIELCKKANLSNDDFIRTVEKRHIKIAEELFKKAYDKGDIYKGEYEGLYCKGCEAFYTEKDLVEGVCPEHKTKPEHIKEESYFFKLSKYKEKILELIKNSLISPQQWSNEIQSRLEREELKDISVSRTGKKWGIVTPIDKNHTIYVWFDALINYYSATRSKSKEKFWPADVHFIGKGINWFHSVIWPGMLFSLEIPQPKKVLVHGYLTFEGQKMSKSLGNVIDPIYLIETYGLDAVRYYLMREIPAGQDGDVSEKSIIERANSDLADALGNLLQRTSVLIEKNFELKIPKQGKLEEIDKKLIAKTEIFEEVDKLMQNFEWHKALEKIFELVHECNKYINEAEPWKLQDKIRIGTIMYTLVESLRIISILLHPFIPETAEKLSHQIGQKIISFKKIKFSKTTKGNIKKPEILFKKLAVKQENLFSILNLKVATIEHVHNHPNADKLYVLQLNLGSEKRQLVAGMKPYYSPEQMLGKHILIISNLKPAVIRGVESQGMMLAAQVGETVKALEAPNSEAGEQVFLEGVAPKTAQITIEDFAKIKLTTKNKKAVFEGKPLKTKKEEISVDIGDGATIR